MKRSSLFILALVLILAALALTACNGTEGGTPDKPHTHNFVNGVCETCGKKNYSEGLKYILNPDGQSYVVRIGNCTDTDIVIPSTYEGKPVTAIGAGAFHDHPELTSVTIPDSVTSIDDNAFLNCTGLTSITIPDSVTYLGYCVFQGCRGLTSVTMGPRVTKIQDRTFYYCTGLTSITIPDSATEIGPFAFAGCKGLTSITIPDNITNIYDSAFIDCTGLTSITASSKNTVYHSQGNCLIDTKNKVLIAGCKTSVIPTDGSVTGIGASAFSGCTGLTSISIPDGVTGIDAYAFSDCTGMISVTIPDSVTSIGNSAFSGCTGLTITFNGTKAQWKAITKKDTWWNTGSYTVHCTDGDIKK